MIRVRFIKNGEWHSFFGFEETVTFLRTQAGMWLTKEVNSNASYKRKVLKRIKRMYGISYVSKNQTDEEFIRNLYKIGEISELLVFEKEMKVGME